MFGPTYLLHAISAIDHCFGTQLDHQVQNPSSPQDQIVSLSFAVSCLHLGVDNLPHQYLLLMEISTLLQKCQSLSIFLMCRLWTEGIVFFGNILGPYWITMSWHSITSELDSSKGKAVLETSNDDIKKCKNFNDLVGGSFDLILTGIWLGGFSSGNRVL